MSVLHCMKGVFIGVGFTENFLLRSSNQLFMYNLEMRRISSKNRGAWIGGLLHWVMLEFLVVSDFSYR